MIRDENGTIIGSSGKLIDFTKRKDLCISIPNSPQDLDTTDIRIISFCGYREIVLYIFTKKKKLLYEFLKKNVEFEKE